MYKMLLFLKKSADEDVVKHFREITITYLSEIAGKEIKFAKVESNFLLEEKFSFYCELSADSKDEMDKLLATRAGRELNKDLMAFHQYFTAIFINYNI
jgi:hypothetical protein